MPLTTVHATKYCHRSTDLPPSHTRDLHSSQTDACQPSAERLRLLSLLSFDIPNRTRGKTVSTNRHAVFFPIILYRNEILAPGFN